MRGGVPWCNVLHQLSRGGDTVVPCGEPWQARVPQAENLPITLVRRAAVVWLTDPQPGRTCRTVDLDFQANRGPHEEAVRITRIGRLRSHCRLYLLDAGGECKGRHGQLSPRQLWGTLVSRGHQLKRSGRPKVADTPTPTRWCRGFLLPSSAAPSWAGPDPRPTW